VVVRLIAVITRLSVQIMKLLTMQFLQPGAMSLLSSPNILSVQHSTKRGEGPVIINGKLSILTQESYLLQADFREGQSLLGEMQTQLRMELIWREQ
jgi:hypothetical protein